MKQIILITIVFALGQLAFSCKTSEETEDSVDIAQEKNAASSVDENISDFLTEAADARMMGIAEAKLAVARGTTPEIRKYGKWMVEDQTILLKKIHALAKSKNVSLPQRISFEKQKGLSELEQKNNKEFDIKFIKMITIDHRRDVRKFKNAQSISDKEVSAFASKYLPVIESHLEKAKEIKTDLAVLENEVIE
jgi:putative membrane protein